MVCFLGEFRMANFFGGMVFFSVLFFVYEFHVFFFSVLFLISCL